MTEITHAKYTQNDLIANVIMRKACRQDLRTLEWEGTYTHYRKVYENTFKRAQMGKTISWLAVLNSYGVIGQVFIQLISSRKDLANGNNRAYLYAFRVRPQFRGLGLGKAMMRFVEKDLLKRGYSEITLNVSKQNILALSLYKKQGYQIVGHESGDWTYRDHNNQLKRIIEPAWKMHKKLN